MPSKYFDLNPLAAEYSTASSSRQEDIFSEIKQILFKVYKKFGTSEEIKTEMDMLLWTCLKKWKGIGNFGTYVYGSLKFASRIVYRKNNPEYYKYYQKEYRESHKDYFKKLGKLYRTSNPEYYKTYKKEHAEYYRAYQIEWRSKNKDRIKAYNKAYKLRKKE